MHSAMTSIAITQKCVNNAALDAALLMAMRCKADVVGLPRTRCPISWPKAAPIVMDGVKAPNACAPKKPV
jgi:hypothetical protein